MEFTMGFIGENKQGLKYEILDATRMKKIKIRFEDGVEVVTNKTYLLKGLPCHPTKFKMFAGEIYKDRDGREFELIEKVRIGSWKIRYLEDDVCTVRSSSTVRDGLGHHPIRTFPQKGQKFKVRTGAVTVLEYNSAHNVLVQFEDGSIVKTSTTSLRNGNVGHPTSGLYVGQKLMTNSGWEFTVEKYISPYEVHLRMQDGSLEVADAGDVKSGSIKPCNQPSVSGVGYMGQGRFTNGLKKHGEKAPDVILSYWHRMITRCFNPEEIKKNSGRRYLFTNINKDWFNFQNFAEWALQQPNWNLGHDLDKDLMGCGLEYSPEKCTFLPQDINVFLAENWSKSVHDLPIGVQLIKPATVGSKTGYVARCHSGDGREYLGYFDDPMEAHFAYKKAKESYAKVLAEKFKAVITEEAYEKLLDFKLNKVYTEAPYSCSNKI